MGHCVMYISGSFLCAVREKLNNTNNSPAGIYNFYFTAIV